MLSFRLKSFSFPGVSVGQGCVLLLAPSCNGKELLLPSLSGPASLFPSSGCSGSLSSFQLEQECWYMCLRWHLTAELSRTIFLFSAVQEHSHCPIPVLRLHPSPAFLTSHSLLIHLFIIIVSGASFSSGWSILTIVVQISSFSFQKHDIWRPCKDFFHHPVGLSQFLLTLLELVWMLSPVWCHHPALCLHHADFIPATHFSFEEHLCCSHISGALLLSLTALVLD